MEDRETQVEELAVAILRAALWAAKERCMKDAAYREDCKRQRPAGQEVRVERTRHHLRVPKDEGIGYCVLASRLDAMGIGEGVGFVSWRPAKKTAKRVRWTWKDYNGEKDQDFFYCGRCGIGVGADYNDAKDCKKCDTVFSGEVSWPAVAAGTAGPLVSEE
mgnify:CR=1 FL=1